MKTSRRFEWGFLASLIAHIVVGVLLAGIGLLVIPKPLDKVVEISMIPGGGGGGGGAPVKQEEVVSEPEHHVAQPDDIVEEQKPEEKVEEYKEEPKVEQKQETPKPVPTPQKEEKPADSASTGKGSSKDSGSGEGPGSGGGSGDGSGGGEGAGVPITPPRVLSMARPPYPSSARSAGQQGTVYVQVLVNADGDVDSASVSDSSGYGALDSAAVNTAYSWSFDPARDRYGQSCACYVNLPVTFSLN